MGGLRKTEVVERWASMRESTVHFFKFNARNTTKAVAFGLAVPLAVYALLQVELKKQDEVYGTQRKTTPW